MQDFIDFPSNIDMDIGAQAPVAQVILAKGIEWDNSYIHVRAYDSVNALVQHVQSKAVWSSNNCSPVKEGTYAFSPDSNSADINDCNYIAFKNAPYSDKWEFGFITDVTWKSHNSCVVTWEYDVFSMCWYGANLLPCFVERMHIAKSDDTIGANVVPDDLETGPMECFKHSSSDWGEMYIGLYLTEMPRGEVPPGTARLYNGVYSGLISYVTPASEYDNVTQLLELYDEGNADAVQLIYMFPKLCLRTEDVPDTDLITMAIDVDYGYTPKNNKIYTYPYSYFIVDDNQGNCNTYKPELTVQGILQMKSFGFRNTMPVVFSCPVNYAGVQNENYNFGFTTNQFPLCAWSVDTFKSWLAQNKNSLALSAISSGINGIGKGFAGASLGSSVGPVGTIVGGLSGFTSGISGIAGIMAQVLDKEVVPNQAKGKIGTDSVNVGLGTVRLDVYGMRPKLSMCKSIDDYWTAFGYPIHQITTPLTNSRSSWNYIKTVDCGFTSDADLDLLKRFRGIFDKGVTIWHTDDVGNYSLANN